MTGFPNFSAAALYGTPTASVPPSAHVDTSAGIATAAGPSALGDTGPWYLPDHPLFVFGILLAASAGLVGFSTSGRFGPASASAKIGRT